MLFVDDYLLTNLLVQKLMAKFDQLWTKLENGMGCVIREDHNKGYQYKKCQVRKKICLILMKGEESSTERFGSPAAAAPPNASGLRPRQLRRTLRAFGP